MLRSRYPASRPFHCSGHKTLTCDVGSGLACFTAVVLLEWVTVFPDHLEVTVVGMPPLAASYGEVGLNESQIVGVGGGTCPNFDWRLQPWKQ